MTAAPSTRCGSVSLSVRSVQNGGVLDEWLSCTSDQAGSYTLFLALKPCTDPMYPHHSPEKGRVLTVFVAWWYLCV